MCREWRTAAVDERQRRRRRRSDVRGNCDGEYGCVLGDLVRPSAYRALHVVVVVYAWSVYNIYIYVCIWWERTEGVYARLRGFNGIEACGRHRGSF